MKNSPRPANTYSNVQPGGVVLPPRPIGTDPRDPVFIPPPVYPPVTNLPPRYPDQEGIDPTLPPPPPLPPQVYPLPIPPRPTTPTDLPPTTQLPPTQPPTTQLPPPVYYPDEPTTPTVPTRPTTPLPQPQPQPTPLPRPNPTPLPQPQPTPLPQPTPRPTTVPRPLPSPLPSPTATRTVVPPTQVAVNTPVAPTRPGQILNAPRPPARPSEFGTVAVASNKPVAEATPATTPGPAINLRKPIESVHGTCEPRPIKVTKQNKKLDILFVVDTSSSLVVGPEDSRVGGELRQIAHGVPEFVRNLPADTDYRIGVLLAHGPTVPVKDIHGRKLKGGGGPSPHFGTLFSAGRADPLVLDRSKMSEKQIVEALERKMVNVPNDYSDAQGEALIMGLYEMTSNTAKLQAAHKAGFFGKNRNLVVIMVTDEQDVCFDYANTGFKPTLKKYVGDKGRVTWEQDRLEIEFFKNVCQKKYGHLITYRDAMDSLRTLESTMDGKVIMQAIAYTKPQPERSDKNDENEQGHGILELVQGMSSGTVADMGNVNRESKSISFTAELNQLGQNAGFLLKYSSSFNCLSNTVHPDAIDLKTLELRVGNKVYLADPRAGKQSDGALKYKIDAQGSKKGLRVWPADQAGYEAAMRSANVENANYEISFETKADVEPTTGLKADGSAPQKVSSTKGVTKTAKTRTKR